MQTQLHLTGDAKTLDALSRFLGALETLQPEPISPPKAICGEDNVIYVEVGYRTDEDTFLVGDHMAQVGAQIVEETDIGDRKYKAPFACPAAAPARRWPAAAGGRSPRVAPAAAPSPPRRPAQAARRQAWCG